MVGQGDDLQGVVQPGGVAPVEQTTEFGVGAGDGGAIVIGAQALVMVTVIGFAKPQYGDRRVEFRLDVVQIHIGGVAEPVERGNGVFGDWPRRLYRRRDGVGRGRGVGPVQGEAELAQLFGAVM